MSPAIVFLIGFFSLPIINYTLYSMACFLDNRYNLNVGERTDDWVMPLIFAFGFFYFLGVIISACAHTCMAINYKITEALALHKKLAEVGRIKRKQATDMTYQLEKHLLGKK